MWAVSVSEYIFHSTIAYVLHEKLQEVGRLARQVLKISGVLKAEIRSHGVRRWVTGAMPVRIRTCLIIIVLVMLAVTAVNACSYV